MKKEDIKELEDLGMEKMTGIAAVDKEIAKVDNAVLGPKPTKPKFKKSKELPTHIRKATITINDKDKGNPIKIVFEGDWVPSDINLAGKFLILDFHSYVRNRAMKGK
jgi:hypothetical protein